MDLANRYPSDYIGMTPTGDLFAVQGEFVHVDENTLDTEAVWESWDTRFMHEKKAEWVVGPDGIRSGIWPYPLTKYMIEAYKQYSLFGFGDEHDTGL